MLPIFDNYLKEVSVKLASKLAEDSKGSEFEGMGKGVLDFATRHKVQLIVVILFCSFFLSSLGGDERDFARGSSPKKKNAWS